MQFGKLEKSFVLLFCIETTHRNPRVRHKDCQYRLFLVRSLDAYFARYRLGRKKFRSEMLHTRPAVGMNSENIAFNEVFL